MGVQRVLAMFEIPGMKGISQTMTAVSVLDASIQVRLNPLMLRKAGAIIQKMQEAEYSDKAINHIARALFCDQSEEDMLLAWQIFDPEDKGELDANEFKTILPLMGEEVPPEEIDLLFEQADTNGSGRLTFDEFVQLVCAMNPREASSGEEEEEEVPQETLDALALQVKMLETRKEQLQHQNKLLEATFCKLVEDPAQ